MMDLPTVNRLYAFADSISMNRNPIDVFCKYHRKLGSSYYFHFGGLQKALVTTNPHIIERVLLKNYKNYPKSDIQVKKMGQFLGEGLLTSHGDYWLTQRRIIQEGFKKDKLKSYLQTMDATAIRNVGLLEKTSGAPIDINRFLKQVTFEMAMGSLYSSNLPAEDLHTISQSISSIQKFILSQIVRPYLNWWTKITGTYGRHQKHRTISDNLIREIIRKRRDGQESRSDMLDILLDARYKETGRGMTEQQILQESMQLLVAGHETSSTALLWTLYLLTQHPPIFEKVRQELGAVEEITMEGLHQSAYTLQVIQESLRLYPPFWMLDREALEDDDIEGIKIKKGTMILLFTYGIHRSAVYWDHPEIFNPDRFHTTQAKKELPFTYFPFGAGPKGCIGGNYATLQMLIILKRLIEQFDISITPGTTAALEPMIILKPKGTFLFHLTRRI